MSTFDFDVSGIRSWLSQGMVTLASSIAPTSLKKQKPSSKKPQRGTLAATSSVGKIQTAGLFVVLMTGINACPLARAVELPNLSASFSSHIPDASYLTKKSLLESLKNIAALGDDWREHGAAPSRQAVIAAEQMVPALPNNISNASVGVDGDGHVYFKLQNGEKLAYLTVESSVMHLLVMAPGEKNVYLDDIKFHPKELPSKVRRTLEQKMVR